MSDSNFVGWDVKPKNARQNLVGKMVTRFRKSFGSETPNNQI